MKELNNSNHKKKTVDISDNKKKTVDTASKINKPLNDFSQTQIWNQSNCIPSTTKDRSEPPIVNKQQHQHDITYTYIVISK